MEIITNDWQAIGLNITFEVMDWPIRWPLVTANNYDMYMHHGAYNVPVTYGVKCSACPASRAGNRSTPGTRPGAAPASSRRRT